jgi:hypothetical protein
MFSLKHLQKNANAMESNVKAIQISLSDAIKTTTHRREQCSQNVHVIT